jgi:hypothetical protein
VVDYAPRCIKQLYSLDELQWLSDS